MRPPDVALALAAALAPLALTACLGVTDNHSVIVKPVPIQLLFQSTPTPGSTPAPAVVPTLAPSAPAATARPVPAPTPTPAVRR